MANLISWYCTASKNEAPIDNRSYEAEEQRNDTTLAIWHDQKQLVNTQHNSKEQLVYIEMYLLHTPPPHH